MTSVNLSSKHEKGRTSLDGIFQRGYPFFLDMSGGPNFEFYRREVELCMEYAPILTLTGLVLPTPSNHSVLKSFGLTPQMNYGQNAVTVCL